MSGSRQTSFIAFSPDGELIIHGGRHAIYVWHAETSDLLAEIPHEWLGMSRDSVTCLTRSGEIVSAWNMRTGQELELGTVERSNFPVNQRSLITVVHGKDANGDMVRSGILIRDAFKAGATATLVRAEGVDSWQISQDGRAVAVLCSGLTDGGDATRGYCMNRHGAIQFEFDANYLIDDLPTVSLSATHQCLAVRTRDGEYALYTTDNGDKLATFQYPHRQGGGQFITVSESDPRLIAYQDTALSFTLVHDSGESHTIKGPRNVLGVAFNAQGTRIAALLQDNTIVMYDTHTYDRLTTIQSKP